VILRGNFRQREVLRKKLDEHLATPTGQAELALIRENEGTVQFEFDSSQRTLEDGGASTELGDFDQDQNWTGAPRFEKDTHYDSKVRIYEQKSGRGDFPALGLRAVPSTSKTPENGVMYIRFLLADAIAHEFGHAADLANGTAATGGNPDNADTPMYETQAIEWENKAAIDRARQKGLGHRPLRDPKIHKATTPGPRDYIEPPK